QAVSEYLGDLADDGFVRTHGRSRYEVTKEGVDWLITATETLQTFVGHVTEDVIGQVDIESAIADEDLERGQRVTLAMADGVLRASPAGIDIVEDGATAVAVTEATAGTDVGVTDFEGLLEYDLGTVTVVVVPPVADGGSRAVDPGRVRSLVEGHDRLAVAGAEAIALAMAADCQPEFQFGTPGAVSEAAAKGLDVVLLVVAPALSAHTDHLREAGVGYEVIDPADG
ncbi:MAG: Crp/Fnr family transcriptional regulator, partial [Halobacteriales archaeon]|nr:Crp/Fnr family transcriptional regulator [Halobacteriales archaeon]